MLSFYGGQAGQDFRIKQVFHNKSELVEDLNKRWFSNIGIGEYVVIAYDMPNHFDKKVLSELREQNLIIDTDTIPPINPQEQYVYHFTTENKYYIWRNNLIHEVSIINDEYFYDYFTSEYMENKQQDLDKYKMSYNGTLWQKFYRQQDQQEDPQKWNEVDTKIFLAEPNSDVILEDVADEAIEIYGLGYRLVMSLTGATPIFDTRTEIIDCDEQTNTYISYSEMTSIDNPVLVVEAPRTKTYTAELIELSPDALATVSLDRDEPLNPYNSNFTFTFGLPDNPNFWIVRAQASQAEPDKWTFRTKNPETGWGGSQEVQILYSIQSPGLTFTGQDLRTGDFIIEESNGFIYYIDKLTEPAFSGDYEYVTATLNYYACIQAPHPEVEVVEIDSYKQNDSGYEFNEIVINNKYTNNETETGWRLEFNLPKMPTFSVTKEELSSISEPTVALTPVFTDENTTTSHLNIHYGLPRATRWFSGSSVPTTIEGALDGDLYLLMINDEENETRGNLYQLQSGTWNLLGNIEGPVGESIHIIKSYNLTTTEIPVYSKEAVGAYIYADLGKYPDTDEVIAINYTDADGVEITHWFTYTPEDGWFDSSITGGIASLLQGTYLNDGTIDSKVYNITFINNNLLCTSQQNENADKKAYSAQYINNLKADIDQALTEVKISWNFF